MRNGADSLTILLRATVAPPAALGGEAQAAQLRFEGVEARQVRIARECASSSGSASASETNTGFAVFGLALALLAKHAVRERKERELHRDEVDAEDRLDVRVPLPRVRLREPVGLVGLAALPIAPPSRLAGDAAEAPTPSNKLSLVYPQKSVTDGHGRTD